MFWICRPYGSDGALHVTTIPPTWAPPYEAREAFTKRKVRGPACILVSKSVRPEETGRGKHRFSVKHRRTDYARSVVRDDDEANIQAALEAQDAAWAAYQETRKQTQEALQGAWGLARSITEAEAKAAEAV